MPIFKYTVSNKDGKKFNGTVEAPDENIARSELNNLGFSILQLSVTTETPKIISGLNKYIFEAIDKNSKLISGSIPAKSEEEALLKLHSEYELNVSAIWLEGSTEEQIKSARVEGQKKFSNQLIPHTSTLTASSDNSPAQDLEKEKNVQFVKSKIENILKTVNDLLKSFEAELAPDQKVEINKKIDKLLRIKNSTNLDYILETANELLTFLENQEKILRENTQKTKRFEFKVQSQKLLNELHHKAADKTLSEDIIGKIETWQKTHVETASASTGAKIINSLLNPIKNLFTTPPEIAAIKDQISVYNKQIWQFIKLYFKEPTPEYKEKVKNSIKSIWQARKKAKENLKKLKIELKNRKISSITEDNLTISFIEELNALSGWLLTFYIIYYFAALYINSKNFGFNVIPDGLQVYQSHLFKYIFVTIFLLHSSTSLKINFFRQSMVANLILPPVFLFTMIISLLNF